MQLFGFEIKRKEEQDLPSVVTPSSAADGSTIVNTGVNAGGYYGMVMDLEGVSRTRTILFVVIVKYHNTVIVMVPLRILLMKPLLLMS
jgi:hypothetical protein